MEAISRARTGEKDCHRPSRQKGSGARRRKEQRREFEGSAVPAIEAGKALDDFGLGATLLGVGEDALEGGLGLLEGGQELAAQEGDERGGQGGRRLPAFATRPLLLDGEDHLMPTEKLKSLADRSFAHSESALDMVEIQGIGRDVQQGVDFGDRARDAEDAGHPNEEFRQLDLMRLERLERGATWAAAGGLI